VPKLAIRSSFSPTPEAYPLPIPRKRISRVRHGVFVFVIAIATASCSGSDADAPPTITPAVAAVSPPVTAAPDGTVRPLPKPIVSSNFDTASRALVVLTGGPGVAPSLALVGVDGRVRTIAVPETATALTGDGRGSAYVAVRGGYVRVDVAKGTAETVEIADRTDTAFTAVVVRADGRVVLGSADGAVDTIDPDHSVAAQVDRFARIDALAAQGNTVFVLDRSQTSVTTLDESGADTAHALRAGEGATTMVADGLGRVLVADTRGNQLLVFGSDPLMLRQRYPVRGAPYGLAASPTLSWVSETATNSVVGYDLATGIPVEKVRYRTVQQPNSLSYDDATDTLYVSSGSGAGVQVITGASHHE
jgi:DNA-binding beta-propeller fold protein YncE